MDTAANASGPVRRALFAVALAISLVLTAGCAPTAPAALTGQSVIGTWVLNAGGTVTLDESSVRFDGLYVSPFGGHTDSDFSGTGTWELGGKSSVDVVLQEWSSVLSGGTAEQPHGASMRAVEHDGEALLVLHGADAETAYYLEKERDHSLSRG